MPTYIAILRGINVSGRNKILMANLKQLFVSLSYGNVSTYIQSGNVIFTSPETSTHIIASTISKTIAYEFGLNVPTLVLTGEQLAHSLNSMPYKSLDLETHGNKVLFTFLEQAPNPVNSAELLNYVKPPEQLSIIDKTVYLHCPNGYGKSKLSNAFIENKLGIKATTRNLKTVTKLVEMTSK